MLLKVKAAGVCHSDLHIWEGGYDLGHGRKPLSLKDRGVSLPRTMGHESVGEVLALGPDAKADNAGIKVGDVVLVYPWLGCGKCETCLGGDENMCAVKPNSLGVYCDGGYADHMTVPNPKYLADRGAAIKLADAELNTRLAPAIVGLLEDPAALEAMHEAAKALAQPDAAAAIARELIALAHDS